ncbi:hypothetical protein CCONF_10190 [Corynebacterium confusum]|nr:hypothetical protein CCONF_10190 [Corynebacterium confusum]
MKLLGFKVSSVTNVNQEKNDATSTSLPLRGFAMVLIAVAVVLGLWALYALTQGGGDEESNPAAATSSAPAGGAEGPTTSASASSQEKNADAERSSDAPSPAPTEDSAPAAGQPEQANPAPAEQPAPKKVSVLNNSMTQGLADRVSRDLEGKGYELGEVGNFPEEVLPETTVFFPKGDAAAEAEARKIASGLGGIARENIDSLPDKATEGRGLTVVVTDA